MIPGNYRQFGFKEGKAIVLANKGVNILSFFSEQANGK
jgi:hypothetical protein